LNKIDLTAKQTQMFLATADEVFGGGSASGGKTFLNKVLSIAVAEQVPGAQIGILRNTTKNLTKNYLQGTFSFNDLLREDIKNKKVRINTHPDLTVRWMDTGSVIHLMHAEHVATTIENLTGIEFALLIVDEASLIDSQIINFSKSRLRIGSLKIDNQFWAERLPRLQLTSNPSGISHSYLKKTYIDPSPPGVPFTDDNGTTKLFIPFGARENPHIDYESYERNLKAMGDPIRYKQLAEGDWDTGQSAFFSDAWRRDKNVVPDFDVPHDWTLTRGYDPGYSSPFGYVIIAKVKGQNEVVAKNGQKLYFPNDSLIVYREWYGCSSENDLVGLRWMHHEIAETMKEKETNWGLAGRVRAGRADHKIWEGELNVLSEYTKRGLSFIKADKAKGSRVTGALKMREMLFAAHDEPLERPALFFVDKCTYCIATIPTLPTDPDNTDDVVTEGVPDHLYDAVRYNVAVSGQTGFAVVETYGL
jgi:hypothetical protein